MRSLEARLERMEGTRFDFDRMPIQDLEKFVLRGTEAKLRVRLGRSPTVEEIKEQSEREGKLFDECTIEQLHELGLGVRAEKVMGNDWYKRFCEL